MWKVLIADDEPKIRRGLRSLIARCGEGFEVVAEAEDGDMAYEQAVATEPDILVIDVRMPFRSGLELIESLASRLPDRIFIIVSGHDEFEYAQAAVKLRVFDYVLKPVDAAAFVAVVERAGAELARRRESGKYASWAREQLDRNLPVLRERFLKDWVTGALSRTEAEESFSFLRIELGSPLCLLGLRFAERPAAAGLGGERAKRLALVAMRTIVEEALPSPGSYVFEDDTETILALAPGLAGEALSAAIDAIERRAAEQVILAPSVASRFVADPLAGASDAYDELCAELADGGACESFVVLARNFLEKNYWKPELCLEDAAEELQISPGYLSRLMKRETGFSFVEYLNRVRVRKATALMSDPAVKVFEAAERAGYRSQHYFSRTFRKVTGVSPSEYRKGGPA